MNDNQGSRDATPEPIKTWTQTTKAPQEGVDQEVGSSSCGLGAGESHVVWKESYESWFRKLFCPRCGHDNRMNLVLDIRDVGGYNMPYYTCKLCHCQFTRKPRYEDVIDRQGRI